MPASIPTGWVSERFGRLARERSVRNRDRNEIPVLSMTKHRGFVPSREYFTKTVHSKDTEHYKVVKRGQFAYATIHLEEGSIDLLRSHSVGLISPMYTVFELTSSMINRYFALRSMKRLALGGRFDAYSNGGVNRRKSISFHDLATFKFCFPPYDEQLAIVDVLQSIEDHISKTRDLLKSLSATKFAVMRDLLTRGMMRGAAPLKPLPERWVLGRIAGDVTHIPSDWKLVRLTSVAKLESGHTPDRKRPDYWGGDIPWLSLGDTNGLGGLTVSTTTECATQLGIQNSSARVLPADTVVFSRTATVGKVTRLAVPMATSQDFANWVCGPKICPRYLVQVFRHMRREWDRLQEGSTHQTIYMPVFKKLQILLPPKDEQRKIADAGDAFDLRIEAEQNKLVELANVRAALAHELLSGRLRLPASMVARFANVAAQPEVAVA
jgi:type I restriction enzyme, S subunit